MVSKTGSALREAASDIKNAESDLDFAYDMAAREKKFAAQCAARKTEVEALARERAQALARQELVMERLSY